MSRFRKLEYEEECRTLPPETPRPIETRDASHWLREADHERRAGRFDNALRDYSRALELDRSATAGWRGQVHMLVLLNECPEAELWSRKALELFPQDGELFAGRAQALCRSGSMRLAQELSDDSLARAGESAYRWMVRGEVLLNTGQATADHCFRKAISLDSDWFIPLEIALTCRHYAMPAKAQGFARLSVQAAGDEPYPWYVLGLCQSDLKMVSAALRSFEHCLEVSPGDADARQRIAELLSRGFSPLSWFRRLW